MYAASVGGAAALGAKMPAWVWAELAESPADAEMMAYKAHAARREARIMAKYGFQ